MFKWLETFQAVYETRSFSQAARLRFISQPSVTAQIQQLETTLGVTLFARGDRKHVVPTPAADYLYQNASKILQRLNQVQHDIGRFANQQTQLTIGASQTTANTLLPQILPPLAAALPTITWQIQVDNSEAVLAGVSRQAFDLGFIEKPLISDDVHRRTIGHDDLIHVGIQNGPWLVREAGSGVGFYTRRYWQDQGLHPKSVIEINHNDTLIQLLESGFGQSLIPNTLLPAGLPVIQPSHISRALYLIYPHQPHPQVAQVIQQIMAQSQK
ncbi:LysR family transcriptional regulator [Lacticaseibacillus brantae]|uniref:LysR family transcriptional regulator n=1 Tax=Lacticaseibacillus brantae DSM 23927 TaxID=1423727 RepID=A0A0R2B6T3_9LACO|nr:LysR family transcriptional regulator [Lacticaseibacillus brantae]KRM71993.1 LysR family transcriptional regulator [Lacticaseibacillus brantae DSM 23927]